MKQKVRAGESGLDNPVGPDMGSRVPTTELGGFQSPAAKNSRAATGQGAQEPPELRGGKEPIVPQPLEGAQCGLPHALIWAPTN